MCGTLRRPGAADNGRSAQWRGSCGVPHGACAQDEGERSPRKTREAHGSRSGHGSDATGCAPVGPGVASSSSRQCRLLQGGGLPVLGKLHVAVDLNDQLVPQQVRPHVRSDPQLLLRLDAALYEPAPPRRPGARGRPRKKGARLPTLAQVLADPATSWQTVSVTNWYGTPERRLEICSQTAVWFHSGLPPVPIRWVLLRDPQGEFDPQALLCTDLDREPVQIIGWFVQRWPVEVTFREARDHLGVETQRQWSDHAIARTTPCLLGLFSLTALLGKQLNPRARLAAVQV